MDPILEVMGDLLIASSLVALRITLRNLERIIIAKIKTPTTMIDSQGITKEISTKTVTTLKKNSENQELTTGTPASITLISFVNLYSIPP